MMMSLFRQPPALSSGSTPLGTPPVLPPSVEHSTPLWNILHLITHRQPLLHPWNRSLLRHTIQFTWLPRSRGKKYRKSYFCPVKWCGSGKPQKKLSNHLIAVHGISSKSERARLLALAKVDGAAKPGAIKVDVRLESCFKKLQTIASPNYLIPTCAIKTGKTNHYPR